MVDTPRALRVAFEIRIQQGLKANVHGNRVEAAVAAFTGAVQGLAGTVFPWADRIRVQHSWSYEWWSATREIELPPTEKITVTSPAASA
ncbi:hypothetical protein [Amycolatopsis sp. cmx-11-12]|uniref:hypothetical protein n=1 Tax=Amycolatopsis sp. cmx-11-12 TaxID=2785795 RepID=UPI0039183292